MMRQDVRIIVLLWVVIQEIFIAPALLFGTVTVQVKAIVCHQSMIIQDAPIFATTTTNNVIGQMRQVVNLMMKMAA